MEDKRGMDLQKGLRTDVEGSTFVLDRGTTLHLTNGDDEARTNARDILSHHGRSRSLALAECAAPVPHEWARLRGIVGDLIADGWRRRDGLWWLPGISGAETSTVSGTGFLVDDSDPGGAGWEAACRRARHLPWALWSALRALGADAPVLCDGEHPPWSPDVALMEPRGALATISGLVVRLRASSGRDGVLLRLGRASAAVMTPGETLEEQLAREAGARVTRTSHRPVDRRPVTTELGLVWDAERPRAHGPDGARLQGRPPAQTVAPVPAFSFSGEPDHRVDAEAQPAVRTSRDRGAGDGRTHSTAVDAEPTRRVPGLPPTRVGPDAAPLLDPSELDDDLAGLLGGSGETPAPELAYVAAANWDDVMAVEVERARRWLAADPVLGRVCLLGPLSFRTYRAVQLRRDAGFLGDAFGLTVAGWWRLAYLAAQGVGGIERRRARALGRATPRYRREARRTTRSVGSGAARCTAAPPAAAFSARHLLLTQRVCMDYMRSGATPLGVEFSALGDAIQAETGYRPDALLVQPDGAMVWVEVNLRPASRLARDYHKYRFIERRHARDVCLRLGRPVLLHLTFGRATRRVHYRPGELYGVESD
jgi:hypothetical protein